MSCFLKDGYCLEKEAVEVVGGPGSGGSQSDFPLRAEFLEEGLSRGQIRSYGGFGSVPFQVPLDGVSQEFVEPHFADYHSLNEQ